MTINFFFQSLFQRTTPAAAMDPVTVPLAGALLATGVIGGGALIESTEHLHPHYWDWDGARNDVKRDLSGRPYDSFSGRLTVDDDYRLRMLEVRMRAHGFAIAPSQPLYCTLAPEMCDMYHCGAWKCCCC